MKILFTLCCTLLGSQGFIRSKRVVNGFAAPLEAAAALVSLESSFPNQNGVTLCGGTILAPRIVLTAAHCVFNEQTLTIASMVQVKVAFNRSSSDLRYTKAFLTNDILIHPQYISWNFPAAYDLALVLLPQEKRLGLCDFVTSPQLARLPNRTHSQLFVDLSKQKCYIVGWGMTERNTYSGVPLHADLIDVKESISFHLNAEVIEAVGHGRQRACFGDSGGPLVCEIDGIPYLVGVNSEIHSDFPIPSFLPLESPQRCAYSRRLQAVDIRKQIHTIESLLASRGLLHTMKDAQSQCFH